MRRAIPSAMHRPDLAATRVADSRHRPGLFTPADWLLAGSEP